MARQVHPSGSAVVGKYRLRVFIMRAHRMVEEFARANGFHSFDLLLIASRHIARHDGGEHFIALRPDGRELEWDEQDVAEIEPDRGAPAQIPRRRQPQRA